MAKKVKRGRKPNPNILPHIEMIKSWKIRNRLAWRKLLVNYHFDCCVVCGYVGCFEAIHCHHVDPDSKEIEIARFIGSHAFNEENKILIIKELEKSIPLCANCHIELHAKEWNLTSQSRAQAIDR